MLAGAHGGRVTTRSWLLMAVNFDRVGFRKIETYLTMRKKLLYTAHAVGSRGSERCEREVFLRKVVHTTRVDPLTSAAVLVALQGSQG